MDRVELSIDGTRYLSYLHFAYSLILSSSVVVLFLRSMPCEYDFAYFIDCLYTCIKHRLFGNHFLSRLLCAGQRVKPKLERTITRSSVCYKIETKFEMSVNTPGG